MTGLVRQTLASAVLMVLFAATTASGATINVATCGQADVQAAVNGAADGDIVSIPAGTCAWATHVLLTNKNIWVRGAGIGQTVISRNGEFTFYVNISSGAKGSHRISHMTLTGDVVSSVIYITSQSIAIVPSGRWRVDHIRFDFPTGQRSGVHVTGVNYGVIDHNEFNWRAGVAVRTAMFVSGECWPGGASWLAGDFVNSQPLDLGTDKFVFVEDNTFTPNDAVPLAAYDSSAGGGRVVFRKNDVTGGFFYNHWTRGCEVAGQVHEIYRNTFIGNASFSAYPVRLESGTGVMFENTIQGYNAPNPPYIFLDDRRPVGGGESNAPLGVCDGTKPWDGNAGDPSAPGWPCLGQIGRAPGKSVATISSGSKQLSAPLYIWKNGVENTCATGGACTDVLGVWATPSAYIKSTPHPNGEVDFVNNKTPKPGYTPYVYPHPLVSGSAPAPTAPATPKNLRIVPGS